MTSITADEIRKSLFGSEHGGNSQQVYTAGFAVPNRILGQSIFDSVAQGKNVSGFSFGVSQLDIGTGNLFAETGYELVLSLSLQEGRIDQATYERLDLYIGKNRYDIEGRYPNLTLNGQNIDLSQTWRSDKALLATLMSYDDAKSIVDLYDNLYIQADLLPKVQNFLNAMQNAYGTDSVFDPSNPNYSDAVATIVDIANRTDNLEKSEQ